jgi:sugar phosphate isomerase/epimerase
LLLGIFSREKVLCYIEGFYNEHRKIFIETGTEKSCTKRIIEEKIMIVSRRTFIKTTAITSSAALTTGCQSEAKNELNTAPLKLGLMSYNLAKTWDIETIIKNCSETGFEHVELRTTHAHSIEVTTPKAERLEVKKRFEDAGIKLSLASGFAYHWADSQKLKEHVEGTKEYTLLGEDLGAIGIRVFPNAIVAGIPEEQTFEQIGKALAEVGQFGYDHGVDIRLCVHGKETDYVPKIKKMIDYSESPYVYVNWNCSPHDDDAPGLEANFNLVKDRIRNIHMHELYEDYPYRHFFQLLKKANYQGYCDAEIAASPEPVRMMHYYRTCFLALQNAV